VKKRVTRRDVAEKAGVSLTTVTHALNPPPGVRMSESTRAKVIRIARELGYFPNYVGKALVTGRTYTVGLLQPYYDAVFNDFYQMMVRGLVAEMEKEDYHPLLLFCSDDFKYMNTVTQGRIDGMVVIQSDFSMAHIDKVRNSGIPLVVLNKTIGRNLPGPFGNVNSDHARLIKEVIEEFVSAGCKTILEIVDPNYCDANFKIAEAFARETAKYSSRGVIGSTLSPSVDNFREQMANFFKSKQKWDGIFIDSVTLVDILAEEAEKAGLKPGKDFYLISSGTENGKSSSSRREKSTYTHQPKEVGRNGWKLLYSLINGKECEKTVLVPYKRYKVN
jgi:LacI family transcriptional regulator